MFLSLYFASCLFALSDTVIWACQAGLSLQRDLNLKGLPGQIKLKTSIILFFLTPTLQTYRWNSPPEQTCSKGQFPLSRMFASLTRVTMKSSEHNNIYTDESFNKKRARQTPVTIRKVKAWKTALKCALKVFTYEGGPAAFQGARALLPPRPPQQEAQQVQHEHGRLGEGAEEGLVIVLSLENVLQKELFHKLNFKGWNSQFKNI